MYRLLVLVVAATVIQAENTYVVVSPSKIRSNMDFTMSVNILKSTADVTLTATILKSDTIIVSGQGTFKAGVPSSLTLKIPANLTSGDYVLKVVGSGGLTFTNQTTLAYSSKEFSIFIQSDKAIYKPGDEVNFRVFAIYPDMKFYNGFFNILIVDGASNKIKQWNEQKSDDGIVTLQLILSAQPVLGDWKIRVETEKTSYEKVITVAKYVLPQFVVDVILPPFILSSDNDLTVTLKAKYTYDKPVEGTASLKLKFLYSYYGSDYSKAQEVSTIQSQVNGEAKVTFPLSEVKKITSSLNGHILIVTANVSESLTGNTMTGNTTVKIYDKDVQLEFPKTNPNTFKPGLSYIAYLQISQPDGRPVMPSNQKVNITTTLVQELEKSTAKRFPFEQDPSESKQLPSQQFDVPDNGVVAIPINFPKKTRSATIQAEYRGVSNSLYLNKMYSPNDAYIQLTLESASNIQAGNEIKFRAKSTNPMPKLVYQIFSRGVLVKSGDVDTANKTEHVFAIRSDSSMAPSFCIVSYYIVEKNGEIVADSVSLDIKGSFENKVAISFNTTDAQPGDKVKVTVTADPNSKVHLMAIDQRVLLLKTGNDVTADDVNAELKEYGTVQVNNNRQPFLDCPNCMRKKRAIWWWPYPVFSGGNDASRVFENSGAKVITDALLFRHQERIPMVMFSMKRGGESSPQDMQEPTRVRVDFDETWLWKNITVGANGSVSLVTTPRDSITSWFASAIASNSISGIGIAPTQAKLRVFRPFFISLNLPYSVIRGENVVIQAIVFNYMQEDMQVRVTLAKSESFSNIVMVEKGKEERRQEETSKQVFVKAGGATSVFFPILPIILGKIDIEVKAQSTKAADAMRKQLLVEAEGVHKEYNIPMFIDLTEGKNFFSQTANLSLPANVVNNSQSIKISVVGDLMGPAISGIDNLIRMPSGCGEQNMLIMGPSVLVTDYLKSINKLSGDIKSKAIDYMESGYQRELTYKHKDGSFSAFGESDASGSTWLTAFVLRIFHQAKSYIFIDTNVLIASLRWLIEKQNSNGSFPEPGVVIHKSMQGNAVSGTSLTVFVLISLLENRDLLNSTGPSSEQALAKAIAYVEDEVVKTDDIYLLSLSAYALQLAHSQQAKFVLDKLDKKASMKDGLKYWHQVETSTTTADIWENPNPTKAIDTEMTSYVALAYIVAGEISKAKVIIQWITKQINPNGGFQSTQDTVVALQALSKFAKAIYSNNFNVQVIVTLSQTESYNFNVDQSNALIYQIQEVSNVPSKIRVEATGSGIALAVVSVFFNVQRDIEKASFELTITLLEEKINFLVLKTCTRWLGKGTSTAMAVEEIGLPSGFDTDLDTIDELLTLKRKEKNNKQIILYFDKIDNTPTCVKVNLIRTGLVTKSQPSPVRVYDYYAPENQITAFYSSKVLEGATTCDVCKDCENCV